MQIGRDWTSFDQLCYFVVNLSFSSIKYRCKRWLRATLPLLVGDRIFENTFPRWSPFSINRLNYCHSCETFSFLFLYEVFCTYFGKLSDIEKVYKDDSNRSNILKILVVIRHLLKPNLAVTRKTFALQGPLDLSLNSKYSNVRLNPHIIINIRIVLIYQ